MTAHHPAPRLRGARRLGSALVAALALLGAIATAPAAHAAPPAATLSLEITPASVTAGDSLVATVTGSAVTDLYSYDLELIFDPALVEPAADEPTGPTGGFTSTVTGPGTLTVSHTRLGTSPGLSGASGVMLASIPLRSLAAGSTRVELSSVRLVSSTGEVVTASAVASGTVVIAALPVPVPQPSVSSSPSPSVSASATATPIPAAQAPGGLATTGVDATPWLISGALGVALLAGGALIVLRRRQAVQK
ncbi:cohesin domain-containing protein [Microbacterium testaceum]|uniref:cohesin domain-containing protein n=1 Tax=Microbacterium testaceum TaxID=2033 RepID=UPI00124800E0|nr:cohesin domain-containing protein [Microbacterium testaceum]